MSIPIAIVHRCTERGRNVPGRNPFAESCQRLAAVALVFVVLAGCDGRTPVSPSSEGVTGVTVSPSNDGLTVSGYVYQTLTRDSGEPPIADALITLRDAAGTESTALSDRRGFYRVQGDGERGGGQRGERGLQHTRIAVRPHRKHRLELQLDAHAAVTHIMTVTPRAHRSLAGIQPRRRAVSCRPARLPASRLQASAPSGARR